jgi:tetratricopeptide (TPR) repeat protein
VVPASLLLIGIAVFAPFAQTGASGSPQGAFGAARPAECGVQEGFRAANKWERAKEPNLQTYCTLLASGTAKLVNGGALAKDVPGIADDADKMLPGRAAPSVLKGRALLKLGKPADALAALKEARTRDDRALDDPVALLAWARANARTGHFEEAAQAYRAALPRTSALSTPERSAASFEAGMIVMAQGPKGIDDAVAMLRQARREAQDSMQVASVVGLALALDRSGQKEEARAVLAERVRSDAKAILSDARITEALADAGVAHEADALVATALEVTDPSAARETWRRYAEGAGGKGPWADHARAHEGAAPARGAKGSAPGAPGASGASGAPKERTR